MTPIIDQAICNTGAKPRFSDGSSEYSEKAGRWGDRLCSSSGFAQFKPGYPASSIRERIYALTGTGYGILLYTATADAEGTLGGLVEVGKPIHEHIRTALEMGPAAAQGLL